MLIQEHKQRCKLNIILTFLKLRIIQITLRVIIGFAIFPHLRIKLMNTIQKVICMIPYLPISINQSFINIINKSNFRQELKKNRAATHKRFIIISIMRRHSLLYFRQQLPFSASPLNKRTNLRLFKFHNTTSRSNT